MKLAALAFVLLSSVAYAEETENFAQAKADTISHIDKRIENLNTLKGCVSAAQDKAALKTCRDNSKAANAQMKEMRKANKTRRQNLREQKRGKKQ